MPPLFQKPSAEKVWQTLKDPYAIAILASVGVHGLLWFGLPLISSSAPKSSNEYRTLNVVELSPLEQQARLPQTSLPQSVPDVISPHSTLPDSTNSTRSTIPVVPLNESVPNTDDSYQIPGVSSSPTSNSSPTTIPDTSRSIQTPSTSTPPKPRTSTTEKTPPPQTQVDDGGNTTEPKENPDRPSTHADDLKPIDKSSSNPDASNRVALQTLYAYNATGTTVQDFEANATIAANKILEKHNVQDWEKPIKARAPYPKEACQFEYEGKSVSGTTGLVVVMQPDGSLSEGTTIIKSSGFKGLDETARKFVETQWNDIVKQNSVDVSNRAKVFPIEVTVKPAEGECVAAPKPAS